MINRKILQNVYIRVCKDSNFSIDPINAAILTANMLHTSPLIVWLAMNDYETMRYIADGTHPVVQTNG